jgi:hypothetical protein
VSEQSGSFARFLFVNSSSKRMPEHPFSQDYLSNQTLFFFSIPNCPNRTADRHFSYPSLTSSFGAISLARFFFSNSSIPPFLFCVSYILYMIQRFTLLIEDEELKSSFSMLGFPYDVLISSCK